MRATFKEVGEIVRRDAAQRFAAVDARSAAGFRVAVRVRGVAVEQRLGKTTGQHPEYGVLQMRKALLPAVYDNQDDVIREFEHAIDVVADHFDNK